VQCAACKATFVAAVPPGATPKPPKKPAQKPAAPGRRLRVGELAVERGLVTLEQLDACLEYQENIHRVPGQPDRHLGEILVEKRLLTAAQLERLLGDQQEPSAQAAAAAIQLPRGRRARSTPITEEQRETLRRTVEAAHRQKAQRVAEAVPVPPTLLRRVVRPIHFAYAAAALILLMAIIALWPAPSAKRTLEAYLESCDEAAVAPDASKAVTDLGLAIRQRGDVTLLPEADYDYTKELQTFAGQGQGNEWKDFLDGVAMPEEKKRALNLLMPAMPGELGPRTIGSLRIRVQPAVCRLVFKRRGMGVYSQGHYRFLLLKATSPSWRCDWKVAAYEPTPAAK
jgi:hypothetical protein